MWYSIYCMLQRDEKVFYGQRYGVQNRGSNHYVTVGKVWYTGNGKVLLVWYKHDLVYRQYVKYSIIGYNIDYICTNVIVNMVCYVSTV